MRRRTSDRGSALLLAIFLSLIVSMILYTALFMSHHTVIALHASVLEEDALHEARGGARWAEQQLQKDHTPRTWERKDNDGGLLKVRIDGETIDSTYLLKLGDGSTIERRVTAEWRRSPRKIELFNWRED